MKYATTPDFAPLSEMVGLSTAALPEELARASEQRFHALFAQASRGDATAQDDLVRLRLAYLNWAYASRDALPSAMQDA